MSAIANAFRAGLCLGDAMGARAVFLVGFMASGKSSVGQELARRLRWDFVDLDARIESRERQTVPQIFDAGGESAFRLAETAALKDLLTAIRTDSVVALGGGAFAQAENRTLLRDRPSVFLETPIDELWQRSLQDKTERPLRKSRDQFIRLYEERLPCYREATVVVDTASKDLAAICTEIEGALQLAVARGSTPDDRLNF
jgi:shikimate kinase